MDQESNDQNQNQGLFQKYQTYVVIGLIVIIAIVIFAANGNDNDGDSADEQTNEEQMSGENGDNQDGSDSEGDSQNGNGSTNGESTNGSNGNGSESANGNVTASGTLLESDNPNIGNLMIDSASVGKVYIATQRDFSNLLNQEVSMQAKGSLQKFTFLGLSAGDVAGTDTTAMGGVPDDEATMEENDGQQSDGDFHFTGTLNVSDNSAKGDYTITGQGTVVYLKTVHNYSGLTGQTVQMTAFGSLEGFTGASLQPVQ